MYRHVAADDVAQLHFEVGRDLAEHLGYPPELLDASRPPPLASFAGTGHHLDLAALRPRRLGARPRVRLGHRRLLRGVTTRPDRARGRRRLHRRAAREGGAPARPRRPLARRLRRGAHRRAAVRRRELRRRDLQRRHQPLAEQGPVFAEAARVLRPGGRLALADIVSGRALKERTRRNVELWAACIAGAIPRDELPRARSRRRASRSRDVRRNDYRFISERALEACCTYEVESISLLAVKPG